jgi:hypothetical protein
MITLQEARKWQEKITQQTAYLNADIARAMAKGLIVVATVSFDDDMQSTSIDVKTLVNPYSIDLEESK